MDISTLEIRVKADKAVSDLKAVGKAASEAGERAKMLGPQFSQAANQASGAFSRFVPLSLGAVSATSALMASAVLLGKSMIEAGDSFVQAKGRITALTGSADGAAMSMEDLYKVSLKTGQATAATAQQFSRFTMASSQIGASREELVRFVEIVQKLGIVGGSSTAEASSGAIQLGQALASGKLQGDELRSILENMPLLAKKLAEGLGVGIGELRKMGEAGTLTSEKVFGALLKKGDEADKMFNTMPATVERASGQMSVAWDGFLVKLDQSLGMSKTLAHDMQILVDLIDKAGKFVAPALGDQLASAKAEAAVAAARAESKTKQFGADGWYSGETDRLNAAAADANSRVAILSALVDAEESYKASIERTGKAQANAAKLEADRTANAAAAKKLRLDVDPIAAAMSERDTRLTQAQNLRVAQFEGKGGLDEASYLKTVAGIERDYADAIDAATDAKKRRSEADKAAKDAAKESERITSTLGAMRSEVGYLVELSNAYAATGQSIEQIEDRYAALTALRSAGLAETSAEGRELSQLVIKRAEEQRAIESALNARNDAKAVLKESMTVEQAYNAELARLVALLPEIARQTGDAAKAQEILNRATENANPYNDKIKQIRQDILTPEQRVAAMQKEVDGLQAYGLTAEEATKYMDDFREKTLETDNIAKDLGLTFTSAFEDAVVGGKNARDVMAGLVDDMARLALRKSLIEPGANFASGLFTKGIGLAANFFLGGAGGTASTPVVNGGMSTPVGASPFANGGIMSEHGPVSLRKYANGGIASSPQVALFGEGRDNEAFVPLPDGRSIPVTMTGGGGGGVTIVHNSTFNIQGGSANGQQGFDPETARAIDRQIKAMLDSNTADWMRKQSRPGGVINPLTA